MTGNGSFCHCSVLLAQEATSRRLQEFIPYRWRSKANHWRSRTSAHPHCLLWRSLVGTLTPMPALAAARRFCEQGSFRMSLSRSSRIAAFIDGPNLYATAKALDFDLDYKRLLNE